MKAILFDMDGVIIDSEPMHTAVSIETMAHYGITVAPIDLERFAGMTFNDIFSILKRENNLTAPVEEITAYLKASILRHIAEDDNHPIDGILQMLDWCQAHNIPAAVASSSPKRLIEAVVNKLEIAGKFHCLVSGEEVPRSKPEPDVYLTAAKKVGVSPAHCLVIEDSRNGATAAKAAGMTCIGFQNPNSGNQDLSCADVIVRKLTEIDLSRF